MTRDPQPVLNRVSRIHFKGLNGLRALAALCVVIGHVGMDQKELGLVGWKQWLIASYSVTLFFTLSGFLITYLLLTERQQYGAVDIRRFYARRILRIWPLYFLVFFVCVVFDAAQHRLPSIGTLVFYATLAPNLPVLLGGGLQYATQYWSLGVEEQFYAFWPLLLSRVRVTRNALSGFLIVFLLLKLGCWFYQKQTDHWLPLAFLNQEKFDDMAIGGLGAYLHFRRPEISGRLARSRWLEALAWAVVFAVAIRYYPAPEILDHEIFAVAGVQLIYSTSLNPTPLIDLSHPVLDFLGRISYGIYMWHLILIGVLAPIMLPISLAPLSKSVFSSAVVVGVTILVSYASYHLFEEPFLKLKDRYSRVRSISSDAEALWQQTAALRSEGCNQRPLGMAAPREAPKAANS